MVWNQNKKELNQLVINFARVGIFAFATMQLYAEETPALPIGRILEAARAHKAQVEREDPNPRPDPSVGRTTRSYVMTPQGLSIKTDPGDPNEPGRAGGPPVRDHQTDADENDGQDNTAFDRIGETLTPELLANFRTCSGARLEQGVSSLNTYWMAALSSIAYLKYPIAFKELKLMGFDEVTFVESASDTEAYVAKKRPKLDESGKPIKDSGLTIIAFRGTDKLDDWFTNMHATTRDISGYKEAWVHEGFALALDEVYAEILKSVALDKDANPIFITGHSLGGALAMQMAIRLVARAEGAAAPLIVADDARLRGVYTFATPRAGNGYARNILDHYLNTTRNLSVGFYIDSDPVPKVPFHWMGYRRFGLQVDLPSKLSASDYGNRGIWQCYADNDFAGPDATSWELWQNDKDMHYMEAYAKNFVPWRQKHILDMAVCEDATELWGPRFEKDDPSSYRPLQTAAQVHQNPCMFSTMTWGGNIE